MQQNDTRPPPSGRPSLFTDAAPAEQPAQHSILSGLDVSKPPLADTPSGRTRALPWIAGGVLLLAACAGTAAWLVDEGRKEIVMAAHAEPVARAQAPLPITPAAPQPAQEEVSAAAILVDVPAAAEAEPGHDDLVTLFDAPKPAVKKVAAAPKKPAPKPVQKAAPKLAAGEAKKPAPKPPTKAQNDHDVALLAALVAHAKSIQPKPTPGAQKLRQCKALASVAEAERCRARACAGSAKQESECKAPSLAKAPEAG